MDQFSSAVNVTARWWQACARAYIYCRSTHLCYNVFGEISTFQSCIFSAGGLRRSAGSGNLRMRGIRESVVTSKNVAPDPGSRIRIKSRGCARSREIICYSQQRRRDTAERRIGEPRENDSPPRLPGTTACRTHQLADDQRSQSWASSPGSEPARTPPSFAPPAWPPAPNSAPPSPAKKPPPARCRSPPPTASCCPQPWPTVPPRARRTASQARHPDRNTTKENRCETNNLRHLDGHRRPVHRGHAYS